MLNKIALFVKRHRMFLVFFAYGVFCWSWILSIDLTELASSNTAGKSMATTVLLVSAFITAGVYTKSLKCLFASLKNTRSWAVPLKLVMWWAATELFVSWVVSIVWYGVGGSFDNVLPFASLSHFAIWTPLGYISRFVGFYGLSGVVFMLLAILVRPNLRKYLVSVVAAVSVLTFFAWAVYRTPSGSKVNVVVVSERSKQDRVTGALQPLDGSLVIFPESSFNGIEDETINIKIKPKNPNEVAYFIGSRFVLEPGTVKNQLAAGDTQNGYTYKIDKNRLIPAGEYLPYVMEALLKIAGAGNVADDFNATRRISKAPGSPRQMLLSLKNMKVGAGICSSIIAPEDYRKLAKNGADIFTNSAYLGIFNNSKIYGWQHESMAKFMATANARAFLQSATSGPSFGFDINGRQLFYKSDTGTTELSVKLNNQRTPYSLFGEYLAIGGLVWMFMNFATSRKKN